MKKKQFRTEGKQREVEEKEKELVEENVVFFIMFCYNNREKGFRIKIEKLNVFSFKYMKPNIFVFLILVRA